MSLFPAYAPENIDAQNLGEIQVKEKSVSPSLDLEASLLASDEEEESPDESDQRGASRASTGDRRRVPSPPPPPNCDYYTDRARDTGNLRVSTLYYPGRPNYSWCQELSLGVADRRERRKRRLKRYYEATVEPPTPLHDEVATRVASYRRLIADAPTDVDLWLRFIRFQEIWSGLGAALEAALEATTRLPAPSGGVRRARWLLARRFKPRPDYLADLRDAIANEKSPSIRTELWTYLLEGLSSSPAECSAPALAAAAHAAIRDTRHYAPAYPKLLHAYGLFLRAAGLWESLVLLIELVARMNFPPSDSFPPKRDVEREAQIEKELLKTEDEIMGCGLPLAARWARLERARATAHWKPATTADEMQADPQRAPLASDVSELLRPSGGGLRLAATLLLLAKVPFFPGCGWLRGPMECWEGALPVLRAARRLPAAVAPASASASAAAAALLADPPHYYTDSSGYRSWVEGLWEACCGWVTGDALRGLLCWRLRWLHALLLSLCLQSESGKSEARRIRNNARAVLRRWASGAGGAVGPLPFLQFARIEARVAGPQAGIKAALLSVRSALRDPSYPSPVKLYSARVLYELSQGDDTSVNAARWAVVCAVLGKPMPDDLESVPPAELVQEAIKRCEERCQELEESYSTSVSSDSEADDSSLEAALLPGDGEWAGARAILASPERRYQLYRRLVARPPPADISHQASRYFEQAACALAAVGGGRWARELAKHAPHNAYLAIAGGGAPLWAGLSESEGTESYETEASVWGTLLPVLLPAVSSQEAGEMRRAAAVARRVAARGGGVGAYTAALELSARAAKARFTPEHVLYDALDQYPHHKWLYVRGACWAAEGGALADLLLARQLRLHALPLELHDPEPTNPREDMDQTK